MSNFTKALTATFALLIILGLGPATGTDTASATPVGPIDSPFPAVHPLALTAPAQDTISAPNATAEQVEQIDEAVALFDSAGLELPPVTILYSDEKDLCKGHHGLYIPSRNEWKRDQVLVCSRLPLILFHELAHAWERHNVSDEVRAEFVEAWGLPTWSDKSFEWGDRGIEMAAHTIAFTFVTTEPVDSEHIAKFGCSYELLTGNELPNPEFFDCDGFDYGTGVTA